MFKSLVARLLPFAIIFFLLQTTLRISLIIRGTLDTDFGVVDTVLVILKGVWFDAVTASFFLLAITLYYLAMPAQKQGGSGDRIGDTLLRFVFSFILLFDFVAEHLFWSEFSTRFNFIAIDYLIYTQEVIGNIMESYPLFWLLSGIGTLAGAITYVSMRLLPLKTAVATPLPGRFSHVLALVAICTVLYTASNIEQTATDENAEAGEVAASGIYNLFYAFWNNEISYSRFYAVATDSDVNKNARKLLEDENSNFINSDNAELTRVIRAQGAEKRKNIMLVVMESMGSDYMYTPDNLTPNLERFAKEGLYFSNTYATGTRTVRGLEALTLSIPPTPGQSIIRRPDNENLFSLGFIFRDRGYDTKFVYGGYGYFDNMNYFFMHNGFDVVDRTDMPKDKIHFANVWGVCDEDMFTRAIDEADRSYAQKKPFMHLIMTTSNHRPFTYPDGRIDIKSHSGRMGGVKYADYSIGKLVEDSKNKPWFKDTIFIFVADHTAGAGGKAELDARKYHIPMIFYAPGFIKPQKFEAISSQIDMAPILLGMLNFSYYTKFYGEDLLHDADEVPHAYISNFQKVALVRNNELLVLAPKRKIEEFSWPDAIAREVDDKEMVSDTIAYYQSASWWKEKFKRIPTIAKPQ